MGLQQRIVCAANRSKKGKIIIGARHYDKIMRSQMNNRQEWVGCEQGFIDQFCNFLTREQAYEIAKKNGQILRHCGGDDGTLYSENLY